MAYTCEGEEITISEPVDVGVNDSPRQVPCVRLGGIAMDLDSHPQVEPTLDKTQAAAPGS